jgi:hypothetical protein
MDARLWLFELMHGPDPLTSADQKREADRKQLQRALSEIDILTCRDPARPFSQRGTSEVGLTFEQGPC